MVNDEHNNYTSPLFMCWPYIFDLASYSSLALYMSGETRSLSGKFVLTKHGWLPAVCP